MKSVWLSIESISNNVVSDHGDGDVTSGADDDGAPEAAAAGPVFSIILRSAAFCFAVAFAPGAAAEAAGVGCAAGSGPSPILAALHAEGLGSAIALAMPNGESPTPTW